MCADMFEAMTGAIFIDGGLEVTRNIVFKILKPFLDRHINLDHIMKHPVSQLYVFRYIVHSINIGNSSKII